MEKNNKIIKQNSSRNILWRLFRISVEEEKIPQEIAENNKEFLNDLLDYTRKEASLHADGK